MLYRVPSIFVLKPLLTERYFHWETKEMTVLLSHPECPGPFVSWALLAPWLSLSTLPLSSQSLSQAPATSWWMLRLLPRVSSARHLSSLVSYFPCDHRQHCCQVFSPASSNIFLPVLWAFISRLLMRSFQLLLTIFSRSSHLCPKPHPQARAMY